MVSNSNINKCPACGALREAMVAVCQDCGYVYTEVNTKVVEDINNQIQGLKSSSMNRLVYNRQYIDIIRTFPIPHLKDEILDVMFFIQPKALEKTSSVSLAWRARQREVFERAKVVCIGDKTHLSIISRYEAELDRVSNRKILNWWYLLPFYSKIALVLFVLFILILIIPAKDVSPEAYALRFNEAVAEKKIDKALQCIEKCPEMGTLITEDYLKLIDLLISDDRMMEAEILMNNGYSYISSSKAREAKESVKKLFVDKYLSNGDIEKAAQYVERDDLTSIVAVFRAYIEKGDDKSALQFYKKHSTSLIKYDYNLHRRALQVDDEIIMDFLNKNGIKI